MAIRISGMNSGLDTESIVSALVSGYQAKVDTQKKAQTKLSWKTEAWQGVNKKVYSLYSNINKMRFTSAYALKKTTISDSTKATVSASGSAVNGTQTLKIKDLARAGYLTGGAMSLAEGATAEKLDGTATLKDLGYDLEDGGTIKVNGKEISVGGSTTIDNFVKQLNDKGVKASFDANNGRIFVSANDSGEKNDFSIGASDTNGLAALSKLGLLTDESIKTSYANINGVNEKDIDTDSAEYQSFANGLAASKNTDASRVKGKNATIELNGATFTSATNNFSINGLTINATATTGNDEITITTATDVDGIYDKIKDFLSEYNEVVNYLQGMYNAASAKGYEPLTEDEKSAMSDTQVEKWEAKIKASLLRRDQNLNGILGGMSNAMAKTYTIGDKSFSLGSFGISTLGYFASAANENYSYHIDGDEDDVYTSSNKDKLKAAINEDPESVIEFMKQLTDGLYKNLGNQMKSSSLRSTNSVYNDKEMAAEYSDYTTTIKRWEDRLTTAENRYYKQFTAMEKALANLQSNSNSLSGFFG